MFYLDLCGWLTQHDLSKQYLTVWVTAETVWRQHDR